jgi:hypothetical protein
MDLDMDRHRKMIKNLAEAQPNPHRAFKELIDTAERLVADSTPK